MIIDAIMDRYAENRDKGTDSWDEEDYGLLIESAEYYGLDDVRKALDGRDEGDVKDALCCYVDDNGYNPWIKDYIMSKEWVPEGDE